MLQVITVREAGERRRRFARSVGLPLWLTRGFRCQLKERNKKSGQRKLFDGSSTVGSGPFLQVLSFSGPETG